MRLKKTILALGLAALVMPLIATDVDLSPAKWGAGDLEFYTRLNRQFGLQNVLAQGANGVVSGTTSASAQRAGLEALQQGGSAADAVLTTSLTQIALAAGSWVSYAGIITMVYYDAATSRYYNLNAAYNTILGENDPMSIPRQSNVLEPTGEEKPAASGRTALVPGYMAGVEAAHKKFGKLPFKALFGPALYYAENGFELNTLHDSMIKRRQKVLARLPETKAVFTKKDGTWYKEGDLFRQPELAKTLRAVAEQGAGFMYTGPWARKLVTAVQADGGKMTMEDLEKYNAIWSEPLKVSYGGCEIFAHGLPAQGGVHIAEALNVAKEANLARMGHYSESPNAFFWLSQITNLQILSFLPKQTLSQYLGGGDGSLESRATEEHARKLWSMMSSGKFALTKVPATQTPKHSDAVVAIDRWGNMAAICHTINTSAWGETGIFVDGVSIPDSASIQQSLVAQTGPGKRLPDPTEPLIIAKGGKPVAALSSIGSGLHQKTISVLMNFIDFGMGIKQAIDKPSMHMPKFEAKGGSKPQIFDGDFCGHLIAGVKALGLELAVVPNTLETRAPRGYVVGVAIGPKGRYEGVGTDSLNGRALAY